MSATKKAKTSDDFDILRQYLLKCPDVAKDSPAVQAALKGLEQEVQKRNRDAKLQQKFAAVTTTSVEISAVTAANNNNSTAVTTTINTSVVEERSNIPTATAAATNRMNMTEEAAENDDDNDDDDWHDVSTSSGDRGLGDDEDHNEHQNDAESSALGIKLSKIVIASIAEAHVEVETPTAALALALHAALRSDLLGFACTGIPEFTSRSSSNSAGGFAPPIRELPKTQFLPVNWDQQATITRQQQPNSAPHAQVALRYRKAGTGSVVLLVSLQDDGMEEEEPNVRIDLLPATTTVTQEPPNAEGMIVPLHHHINPDSFAAAISKQQQGHVQPALHYKRLAVLLTAFLNRFDLGQVKDHDIVMEEAGIHSSTTTVEQLQQPQPQQPQPTIYTMVQPPSCNTPYDPSLRGKNPLRPMRDPFRNPGGNLLEPDMEIFHPHFSGSTSDFAGDLMPGGLMDHPGFGAPALYRPGNLMGPDHPLFHGDDSGSGGGIGGGISGVGPRNGYGMKPRFDPYGPPGGPTEPFHVGGDTNNNNKKNPRLKIPPGGTGEPNHDHMRPPNNLNNNMFG